MLSARSLTMQYPGVKALNGVDFDVCAGEIHALCGENGAGKSTLIKILSGIIPYGEYGGQVEFGGEATRFKGPGDALHAGIRVIHQELALCPDFTVAENIFLGTEPILYGLIDNARMVTEAKSELQKLGLSDLDPRTKTDALPVGIRQMVEIARALKSPTEKNSGGQHGKILILDEPTSALSVREAEHLEETLRTLRDKGFAILYISHRLDEVFRLADRITVLRNGESRGTILRANEEIPFDPDIIVSLMIGREASPMGNTATGRPSKIAGQAAPTTVLSVQNWTVPSPNNSARNVVEDISFELHAGEILGLCGLMGAGRTELVESLCGLFPDQQSFRNSAGGRGKIRIEGKPYTPRDAGHAHANGIALVCEDRRGHGIMPDKSVRANITYASLRDFCSKIPGLGWLLQSAPEQLAATAQVESLRVKTPGIEFPVGKLSGGNQQKTLIGRALLTSPKVLILDEPTRGIDVGAKAEVYALIRMLASSGTAILLISSENGEALRLSDRVLILRNGKIVAAREAADTTEIEILALASGGTTAS